MSVYVQSMKSKNLMFQQRSKSSNDFTVRGQNTSKNSKHSRQQKLGQGVGLALGSLEEESGRTGGINLKSLQKNLKKNVGKTSGTSGGISVRNPFLKMSSVESKASCKSSNLIEGTGNQEASCILIDSACSFVWPFSHEGTKAGGKPFFGKSG